MSLKTRRILFILFFALCAGVVSLGVVLDIRELTAAGIIVFVSGCVAVAVILSMVSVEKIVKKPSGDGDGEGARYKTRADGDDSELDADDETDYDSEINEDSETDDDSEKNANSANDEELRMIEEINSASGAENRIAYARHAVSHAKKAYAASDKKTRVLGRIFLTVLFALIFGGVAFTFLGYYVVGLSCLGGFAGIILIAVITVSIKQRISLGGKGFEEEVFDATVKLSVISSKRTQENNGVITVTDVVYKIILDVNGEEKIAYSRTCYNEGDSVKVRLHEKSKSAAMIAE